MQGEIVFERTEVKKFWHTSRLFLSNTLLKSLKKETPLVSIALTAANKHIRSIVVIRLRIAGNFLETRVNFEDLGEKCWLAAINYSNWFIKFQRQVWTMYLPDKSNITNLSSEYFLVSSSASQSSIHREILSYMKVMLVLKLLCILSDSRTWSSS